MATPAAARSNSNSVRVPKKSHQSAILPQEEFERALHLEQKRTERSRRPFVLMLVVLSDRLLSAGVGDLIHRLETGLLTSTRDTDVTGWYRQGLAVGTILTETAATESLLARFTSTLSAHLTAAEFEQISLSLHTFPDDWVNAEGIRPESVVDGSDWEQPRKPILWAKRFLDVVGSLVALILLLPLLLLIAAAVRLTSKGPILFRQERVGCHGRKFTFLKFRSMYVSNDPTVHQRYVEDFIAGKVDAGDGSKPLFKLKGDARITPIGHFLRRTSLDELPQFINVLTGEMALVGPRPAIPYEVNKYQTWHRRRYLSVKPGITGLWQVRGRSRTTFDEMVRLDLKYARTWSLWMDLRILVETPLAVLRGDGAC